MVRKVGFSALGALLTLCFVAAPRANAQLSFDSPIDETSTSIAWTDSHNMRAMDAVNKMTLTKEEMDAVRLYIRELDEAEQTRKGEIRQLEHDLLFDHYHYINADARMVEIEENHKKRVSAAWARITEAIGFERTMVLRSAIYGTPAVDTSSYYQSDRIARIDSILVEWDKATAERVAAHEEYNRKVAAQVAALEEHDRRVAREEADAKIQRAQALAAAQPVEAAPPVVAVTPVEPAPAPATVQAEATPVPASQPARAFRSTPARQEQRRTRRVRGLG